MTTRPPVSTIRLVFVFLVCAVFSGCAVPFVPALARNKKPPRKPAGQESGNPAAPEGAPTPAPAKPAKPEPTPPRKPVSSDEVWLVEMLIQRLEIAAAISAALPAPADPENETGELTAASELASRFGLPQVVATPVFSAQMAAAARQDALLRKSGGYPPGSAAFLPALMRQREAVDTQIIATLLRLKRVPGGKDFLRHAREAFRMRGIENPVTKIALKPFPEKLP